MNQGGRPVGGPQAVRKNDKSYGRGSLVTDGHSIKVRLEADRLTTGSMVHVDWLRFTVRTRYVPAVYPELPIVSDNIWDEGYRLRQFSKILQGLPDCERDTCSQAAEVADRVALVLGEGFARGPQLEKGRDFYKHRWPILRNDTECGWVGFGAASNSPSKSAQDATIHVNVFGSACTFAHPTWRMAMADLCDELKADITRCDLALDFFDGLSGGIDRVVEDYRAGLCNSGRRKLVSSVAGDWLNGRSRSVYFGSKESGKETNVYEKGDQLFGVDADSKWIRVELRYGNKLRELPNDMLRRPADFFAGASEWHQTVLAEAGTVAVAQPVHVEGRLAPMTVEAEVFRNLKWSFQTAAASIAAAFRFLADEDFLRLVSQQKLPGRLQRFTPSELKSAFTAAVSRPQVSEPCPALA